MPGYQTKQEHIAVRGVDDIVIRSLLDRQQFSDPLGDALAAGHLVGRLADVRSAVALGRAAGRAHRAAASADGERILELGCGLALASLVGHRRGADITASDCHPLAASFLLENLRLNALGRR
jgi:2-polyprenyl-3-methyl-5-hydroxy-6-metoxy-1,4-benzoquinol methylase